MIQETSLTPRLNIPLIRYDAACRALAEAKSTDEVKDIRDKSEAMRAYARQAKNKQLEVDAAEIRFRAERRLGEMITIQKEMEGLNVGGGCQNGTPTSDEGVLFSPPTLAEVGIDYHLSSRAQKMAAVPQEEFEQKVSDWRNRVEQETERVTVDLLKSGESQMNVHYSSRRDDWETPQDLFDELDREFSFTLDVCALPSSAKCQTYFSPEDNGLSKEWTGICWMNPPYGDEISEWMKKASDSAKDSAIVVCLVPARVDTHWWWNCCIQGEIRFLRGRLKFGGGTMSAPFPSAVVILGPGVESCVKWWQR